MYFALPRPCLVLFLEAVYAHSFISVSDCPQMRFYYTIQGPTNAVLTVKTRSTADGDFNDVWKSDRPTEFRHFTEAFVPFHEASDFEVKTDA